MRSSFVGGVRLAQRPSDCQLPTETTAYGKRLRRFRWVDHDLPVFALAGALGVDRRIRPQRQMNDTSLIGAHRLQSERPAALAYAFGHPARQTFQGLLAALAIVAD